MSNRTLNLNDRLYDYLLDVSLREPEPLTRLRQETVQMEQASMQIAPEQGQFMTLLARLIGARKAIDIGTFTGYSAACIARALPSYGRLFCCDISDEWTQIARRYWQELGLSDRIEVHLAPASQTLQELLLAGHANTVDFAFIDADKSGYDEYYELCLKLLRPGGLIVMDNVLWKGQVADESFQDTDTEALRQLNLKLRTDERVDLSVLPVADGLTLARKR